MGSIFISDVGWCDETLGEHFTPSPNLYIFVHISWLKSLLLGGVGDNVIVEGGSDISKHIGWGNLQTGQDFLLVSYLGFLQNKK